MLPEWSIVSSLLGGTISMRDAGTSLLPSHENESDGAYQERLSRSVLLNLTSLTLDSWVGRPFRDPLKDSELPDDQRSWFGDVDKQGNGLDVWARNWFSDGLAKGLTHALVDFPRPRDTQSEEGRPRTLADDNQEGLRPYFVHVRPENVLFAHAEMIDGVEVLTHVRIAQTIVERDKYEEVVINQIKIFEPGHVEIWQEKNKNRSNARTEYTLVDAYDYDLDFIPMVTFYAYRTGFMTAKSPLLDLAYLNVAHWQSDSDQTNILTVSRFPMLAGSGIGEEDHMTVGPNTMLKTSDPQGRYYYVEHTGKAIAAGDQHLASLEDRMKGYGAEFLKKRPGRETATARALDSAESSSALQSTTIAFGDAVNELYRMAAAWQNSEPGTVEINNDFGADETDSRALDAIRDARAGRDLSREVFLHELVRHNVLSDDFDAAQNQSDLEAEATAILGSPAFNIDPGAPEPDTKRKPDPEKKPDDEGPDDK